MPTARGQDFLGHETPTTEMMQLETLLTNVKAAVKPLMKVLKFHGICSLLNLGPRNFDHVLVIFKALFSIIRLLLSNIYYPNKERCTLETLGRSFDDVRSA